MTPDCCYNRKLSQNSLARLNYAIQSHGFSGRFGSPYVKSAISRNEEAKELWAAGFPAMYDRTLSGDENLWCREFEGGMATIPKIFMYLKAVWLWTKASKPTAPSPTHLAFKRAFPSRLTVKPCLFWTSFAHERKDRPLRTWPLWRAERSPRGKGSGNSGSTCGLPHNASASPPETATLSKNVLK